MYNRVLAPLDTSERAERILPHLESLSSIKQGHVVLLHVVEPAVFMPAPPGAMAAPGAGAGTAYEDVIERMRTSAEEYLSKIQSRLEERGIPSEIVIDIGSVVERIIHTAEEKQVDLIAIASHGRTGLSRVFFGSVAAGVLHRSEVPLLLVRSRDES